MKKKKILLIIGCLIILLGFIGYFSFNKAKRVFYNRLISNTYRPTWYQLAFSEGLFSKKDYFQDTIFQKMDDNFWSEFHVADFVLSLPIHHPLYSVAPIVEEVNKGDGPLLGFSFSTRDQKEIASIYFLKSIPFSRKLDSQKLFQIPLLANIIGKKSNNQIWRDMFSLDLQNSNISFDQMIYNLYILNLRSRFFSEKTNFFSYISESDTGVLELDSKDKKYSVDIFFKINSQGTISSFLIKKRVEGTEATILVDRIMSTIRDELSYPGKAMMIYREFKALSYAQQTDQEGMVYLFSAWSQDLTNKSFLKAMIDFLERGKGNLNQLGPLYRYAKRFYNDQSLTSSDRSNSLLERTILEKGNKETDQEIEKERKKIIDPNDLNSATKAERVDYLLRKAKNKEQKGQIEKHLIID